MQYILNITFYYANLHDMYKSMCVVRTTIYYKYEYSVYTSSYAEGLEQQSSNFVETNFVLS